ncbi:MULTISPECIES: KAP family P-loop NTPase fold protein [Pseudoalteromonas]|uniref:KAP NTPase domain-containing protein n=1 Tax=Pseudoalteromonas fuliginea TaxID=1872678 RepID=A0ABD3Y6V8_9GAMM|nr:MULTISPECIES: P-loop NTPase fold protein [Pseudoalteromonas]ALQ06594.1 hypothetical protein D172_000140 [Pseudoalteromonas sp. Bsw20308]KDC49561.1 hypothetical protein DC53_16075 [Pseudoalteromonas fuliginea]KJZ25814.1 phage protein [Pseudoalteromonas fuliginea]
MKTKEWKEEVKINGVTYPADQLNRKQDAELLTKILVRRSNANSEKPNKSSYVINVNAEWGAGKTYFIKRWAKDLKYEHPVVYIDAWSNDFMDSPIITVLAEIQEQLLKTVNQSYLSKEKKKRFKNLGMSVLPKILAALVKRYGGFDIEELFVDENSDTDISSSTQSNKSLDLSAAMEAMTTQAFKEHSDYKKGVKELKGTIKELIKYSIEKPKGSLATARIYPAFIFIDELDRCRPTYAVEMLEAIKHIFDVEGLVIVVSTHTEELQHTIKALYGNNFNADNYLRRFFDTKFNLDVEVSANLLVANCDFTVLNNHYLEQKSVLLFPLLSPEDIKRQLSSLIAKISNWQNLTPRSAIQLTDRLLTCIELISDEKTVDVIVLSTLVCLYMFNKPEYDNMYSVLKENLFTVESKLDLYCKQLNLPHYLKEMVSSTRDYEGVKQLLILGGYERETFMYHNSNFADINLITYFRSFQCVLKRADNIKKTNYMNTFGYNGSGSVSGSQLLEAYMTFFGVNSFTANDYLNLIGLTSKFADS